MDVISLDDIISCKRLIICCSSLGEGDLPDNALDLYDAVEESEDGSLSGVNFAVLALGDTAFEMFCQSGIEWDIILEQKGGTRINNRVECDTDYEDDAEEWIQATLELMKGTE